MSPRRTQRGRHRDGTRTTDGHITDRHAPNGETATDGRVRRRHRGWGTHDRDTRPTDHRHRRGGRLQSTEANRTTATTICCKTSNPAHVCIIERAIEGERSRLSLTAGRPRRLSPRPTNHRTAPSNAVQTDNHIVYLYCTIWDTGGRLSAVVDGWKRGHYNHRTARPSDPSTSHYQYQTNA